MPLFYGAISGVLAVASYGALVVAELIPQPEVSVVGTLASGGLAVGAILFLLKHTGDADRHINKRDNFVDSDVCANNRIITEREREANRKAIVAIHLRLDMVLATVAERHDLVKRISHGETIDVLYEIRKETAQNGD